MNDTKEPRPEDNPQFLKHMKEAKRVNKNPPKGVNSA